MITRKKLQKKLKEENIQCNILAFEKIDDDEIWFAFSFAEGHTKLEKKDFIDAETEDDAIIGYYCDDYCDLEEAINCIEMSRLNPRNMEATK